jgi:hypothetical protein
VSEETEDEEKLSQNTTFDDDIAISRQEQVETQKYPQGDAEADVDVEDSPVVAHGASPAKRSSNDDLSSDAENIPVTKVSGRFGRTPDD